MLALEGFGVEIAGALVEQARDQIGAAGGIVGIARGAAVEGEIDRDQRQAVLLDQPGLDAAGARAPSGRRPRGRRRERRAAMQRRSEGRIHWQIPSAAAVAAAQKWGGAGLDGPAPGGMRLRPAAAAGR